MADNSSPVRVVLVTGYLGAGKTTLLNHVLGNDRGLRAAVIVNDIGEVNIDAELIREGGIAQTDSVIPLTNGCICCTLSNDLAEQLGGLADSGNYDYIVIEASGICEPMPIAYTISAFCEGTDENSPHAPLALDNIVAVVDCARMIEEFDGGKRLVGNEYDEDDVESLLIEQLEFCTTVVLNKTDLITTAQLEEVHTIVRALQKDAVIVEAEHGDAPLEQVFDTERFDFDEVYRSAAWLDMMAHPEHHHEGEALEYGFTTFVYERRRPFSVDAFSEFVPTWPSTIIRTKGMVWFDQQPDTCFLLEQAGSQRSLMDNGPFAASLPDEEREQMLAENPGIRLHWDDECGDRRTLLVLIGRNMDQQAIVESLDACLTSWNQPTASVS